MTANIQPLALDAMLQNGAVLCNAPVVRVTVQWADGRKMEVDLPKSFAAPLTEEQAREAAIVAFMAKIADGERVKGQTIASELNEEYDTIRKTLSGLVAREVLYAKQGVSGYSKGPKFASFKP